MWPQTEAGEPAGAEPFVAGAKELGLSGTLRYRDAKREISQSRPFECMVRADNWRNEFIKTSSIRSGKSLEAHIQALKLTNPSIEQL